MTKKSVEILGLPVISITEGRELGISKTLVIDAKKGAAAAVTIEDEDWYRGVKLLPWSSVVSIGRDAMTVISSESILTLAESEDYEAMLDDNIRVIGTKAITKTGTIYGSVSEIYVGDDGLLEIIRYSAPDGTESDIPADEISVFGKQVTIIGDPGDGAYRRSNAARIASVPAPETASGPLSGVVSESEPPAVGVETSPEPEVAPEPEPEAEIPAPEPIKVPATRTKKTAGESDTAGRSSLDRHRRFLLGKKAARDIVAGSGAIVVKVGEEITEAVLQKAQLAGKLVALSMNSQ